MCGPSNRKGRKGKLVWEAEDGDLGDGSLMWARPDVARFEYGGRSHG
jgi:hypothetical protein